VAGAGPAAEHRVTRKSGAPRSGERRASGRTRFDVATGLLYKGLRFSIGRIESFRTAVGVFLIVGTLIAALGTFVFARLADEVREGATQVFDDRVMTWMGQHRIDWLEQALVEVTALGTGVVVLSIVGVSAMFLWLTRHKYSAALLLVSTTGGIILNNVLKLFFMRERPRAFEWAAHASSSSFPSGHAMSAAIVYATVGYLAARLQKRRWARWLTLAFAMVLIVLICASRVYLGVHYPTDVLAGLVLGLAWAGFCMATLEAVQVLGAKRAVQIHKDEEPAPVST
jgi:undecaprenyl-diphosphatase